ncbi:MAG TPA: sigma factor-like helix-turn-helix DNA-binding protein, partial [Opitutaceae bacterium]|nr:sigma factor-like helix-turn-helix DNA-binding protein [Opitutaceae bacterium]
ERQAVLLRYFQGRSLREVGAALAISDDTAQKRISRAIASLQRYFAKRDLAMGAATLTEGLSHHAVRAAPAVLSAKILASAVAKGAWSSAALAASKGAAAGLMQKAALILTALALGAGLLETGNWARRARTLRAERQRRGALEAEADRLAWDQAAAAGRLKAAEGEIDRRLADAQPGSDAALEARISTWLGQIDRLKATLAERPGLSIPQLRYLNDRDWLAAASGLNLDSDERVRRALANLRSKAQARMALKIQAALGRYFQANGAMPTDPSQLAPFFDEAVPAEVLDQYAVKPNPFQGKSHPSPTIIAIKAPADLAYDQYWQIGTDLTVAGSALSDDVTVARRRYASANHGATTTDPALLQPYLMWPADPELVRRWFTADSGSKR